MNLKKKDVINLTEKHYIAEDDPDFKIIDNLAYKCKNLKNAILYELRQQFFANGTFLSRKILEKRFRDTKNPDFIALMGAISQHVFMMVYSEYKSFFGLNKAYKKGKIKDKPNIPNYLHKTEGRYVVCFTNQQCRIRNGWVIIRCWNRFKTNQDQYNRKTHCRSDSHEERQIQNRNYI